MRREVAWWTELDDTSSTSKNAVMNTAPAAGLPVAWTMIARNGSLRQLLSHRDANTTRRIVAVLTPLTRCSSLRRDLVSSTAAPRT